MKRTLLTILLAIVAVLGIAATGTVIQRLRDLTDVKLPAPASVASGDALRWNGTKWTNSPVGGATATNLASGLSATNLLLVTPRNTRFTNIGATTVTVDDDAYAAGWDGSTNVPTKNAVYDEMETKGAGDMLQATYDTGGDGTVDAAQSLTSDAYPLVSPSFTTPADTTYTNLHTTELHVTGNSQVDGTNTVDHGDFTTVAIGNATGSGAVLYSTAGASTNQVLLTPAITWGGQTETQTGGTNYTLAFAGGTNTYQYLSLTMTGNVHFAFTTNRSAWRGRSVILRGGAGMGLSFNSSFHLLGTLADGVVVTNTYALSFLTDGDSETNVFVSGQYAE